MHVELGNSITHNAPAVQKWLIAHPRLVVHFTPTSSWLSLVERWFSELPTKKLRRAARRSVRQLNTDIRAWITPLERESPTLRVDQDATRSLNSSPPYCAQIGESER